jgi:threonine synthase
VALAALIKLVKTGEIDRKERVVVISTAHGLKFTEFKVNYHQQQLGFPCQHANKPIELPPRVDAVKEALAHALKSRNNIHV